jgi:hypothetical protein
MLGVSMSVYLVLVLVGLSPAILAILCEVVAGD